MIGAYNWVAWAPAQSRTLSTRVPKGESCSVRQRTADWTQVGILRTPDKVPRPRVPTPNALRASQANRLQPKEQGPSLLVVSRRSSPRLGMNQEATESSARPSTWRLASPSRADPSGVRIASVWSRSHRFRLASYRAMNSSGRIAPTTSRTTSKGRSSGVLNRTHDFPISSFKPASAKPSSRRLTSPGFM